MDPLLEEVGRRMSHCFDRYLATGEALPDRKRGSPLSFAGRTESRPLTLWQDLSRLMIWGFAVPTERGGLDLGFRAAVFVAEQMGRSGVETPFLDTLDALDTLIEAERPDYHAGLIERIVAGEDCWAVVSSNSRDNAPVLCGTMAEGTSFCRGFANYALLRVDVHDRYPAFVCLKDGDGIRASGSRTSCATVEFDSHLLTSAQHIDCGAERHALLVAKHYTRLAGYLYGVLDGALSTTVDFVRSRQSFGSPLATRQWVMFKLAGLYAEREAVRLLVARAADATQEEEAEASLLALRALSLSIDTCLKVTRTCVHFHGAHGLIAHEKVFHFFVQAASQAQRFGSPAKIAGLVAQEYLARAASDKLIGGA